MLFQGEEHGETAPFQFFADHIDEEIAVATREGRRREFAAFAEFAGEEVPDPQDPATFERSKLTREGEPEGLRDLYARLLEARRAIGPGEAHAEYDEHQGWLTVRRGEHLVLANFSRRPCTSPSTAPSSSSSPPTTPRSSPATSSCPRWPERWSGEPRLARPAVPARRDLGRAAARTSRCSPSTPSASSCACSTRTTRRSGSS